LIACQFALLYSGIFLDDWLCRGGWMLALIMTASWSLRPEFVQANWLKISLIYLLNVLVH